jgi:N-acetylglucosaminyldiphosphoundecaprenol N-acetyl-beta-D-mannosaminyltransferase
MAIEAPTRERLPLHQAGSAIDALPALSVTVPAAEIRPYAAARPRVPLGWVWIDQVDLPSAVERIRRFLLSGTPHQIVTVNLDFLSIAKRQPGFCEVINGADLAVADGMPLVWASRLQGQPLPERVTGVDLVEASCRLAVELNRSVFLLGAAPGVAAGAARTLQERFPSLRLAGLYSPPFGPLSAEEDERIVAMIRDAAPDLLFVALGAPRQDLWIHQHLHRLNVPVAMGVGCVFDLLAGVVNRAPSWMQAAGLEWAYRLGQEPRRLWRRYLLNDLPTLARLLLSPSVGPSVGEQAGAAAAAGNLKVS